MGPYTTIYVSAYHSMCPRILLYVCLHGTICVLILLRVLILLHASSCYYIWPHATLMCPHSILCVLILLYMCLHTPLCPCITTYCSLCVHIFSVPANCAYVSAYYSISVLILLYVSAHYCMFCPHTPVHVSAYCSIFVLILLCMCPQATVCVLIPIYVSARLI